jgi:hypothetical protein
VQYYSDGTACDFTGTRVVAIFLYDFFGSCRCFPKQYSTHVLKAAHKFSVYRKNNANISALIKFELAKNSR